MPDVMIVVPTYNEVEGLERTVGRLRQSVPHAELVIIDADTTPRRFNNELRWNSAYHRLNLGT